MAIHSADKIFVDVNDEINFVIEKILSSKQDRVIVAVPQNALIISSLVSMKVLAKQIVKSKKEVVIVTEDRFGMQLAERSGLVSTNKVSSITPEMWEVAHLKKERALEEVEQKKQQLLTDRGILPAAGTAAGSEPEVLEVAVDAESDEQVEIEQSEETEVEPEPETELEVEPEEEIKGPIQRRRREGKKLTVAGFEIFAGGDVDQPTQDEEDNANIPPEQESRIMDEPEGEKRKVGFTGRDWTSATKSSKPKSSGLSAPKLFGEGSLFDRLRGNKLLLGGIAITLLVFLAAVYVLAFVINSVEIRLELKTADVPVEQQITADPTFLDPDLDNLIIPARVIEEEANASRTGTATGEGTRGNKAGGLIEIWNYKTQPVTIKKGTVFTNATTGLKYVLQEAATVEAGTTDGTVTDPGGVNVEYRIEAEKFGEQYNIDGSDDESINLKIEGHATSEVVGKRFRDIDGGTSESFVAVSKENLDNEAEQLEERIKSQINSGLRDRVGNDEVLLTGSEEYEEVEKYANPEVGEEADKFTANLVLKGTAYVVKKNDLDAAIAALISKNQESEINFEVDSLSGSAVDNVEISEGKVTFTVSSNGNLKSKVDEEKIKNDIAGMSLEDARDYFDFEVPEVESARIVFSPGIVPAFLQRIPGDHSKIRLIY